jgi:hypothetical protein
MSEIIIGTIVGITALVLGREFDDEWLAARLQALCKSLRIAGRWAAIGLGIICASAVAGVVIAACWP